MSTLSDRLKALGVKVGAQDLPRPAAQRPASLETAIGGQMIETPLGEVFVADEYRPLGSPYGAASLELNAPRDMLAMWAGDERIAQLPATAFTFLDTETTGLAGGAGTLVFLVGLSRIEDAGDAGTPILHLRQFFLRNPQEETAQLYAIEQFLAPCQAIVSFNGKAFDAPLLNARYTIHGWRSPFAGLAHIDLLPLARRLWRDRLPSRTLGNLEVQILGATRSEDDIPGWLVPEYYFNYLRDGDPAPLKSVFYHNAVDVFSLTALMNHTAQLLADPFNAEIEHGVDVIAIAKLYEDLGQLDTAARLYLYGLEHDLSLSVTLDALQRLALLYKHRQEMETAVTLWQQAAQRKHIQAHIELAMYYEHQQRDAKTALMWTQSAIELVLSPGGEMLRIQYLQQLQHRQERLLRKSNRSG